MNNNRDNRIIGYYERPNVIKPIFDQVSMDEFKQQYPGKLPVFSGDLADDEDYESGPEEEMEADGFVKMTA